MKKYIKPIMIVCPANSPAILAGSIGTIYGDYDGEMPLKAKDSSILDLDEEELN